MKKLPDEQVASFIQSGTLKCHDENGNLLSGAIRFILEEELKKLVDFPNDLKRPIENEKQEIQYFVPDSIWLFSPYEIIKYKKLFVSWLKAAVIHYADQGNYTKKQKMLQLGRKLLGLVYDYQEVSLFSKELWNNFNFSYSDKVAIHSTNFSNLFENIEDIIEFQKILPAEFKSVQSKTRRNLENNIMYYTYLKAVNKLAVNYSLSSTPLIIRSRLQQSSSYTCYLEILNVAQKYKFSCIEDIVNKLFNTSTNTKIIDKAKKILVENNAFKPQTQIILNEDEFTTYNKSIEVNFLALKEKVNDNLLVTHTLVNLIYHYLNSRYSVIKNTSVLTVSFKIRTQYIHEIEEFSQILNQCISYAFDVFITQNLFDQFSKSQRGARIAYENHKNIQSDFRLGFESFCRKDILEKKLFTKDEKEKVKKI